MRYKAIIVSDLHLGTKDCMAKEFIDFLDIHSTELLILNGDIVDGWALGRGSKWKKSHTKVLIRLLKLSEKTRIIWIRGNHDEFLDDFMDMGFGNIEIREDYVLNLGDRSYYIFHGDKIDVFITKYKWLAKIGSIGYDLALWLNRWYNRWRSWRGLPYRSISQDIKGGVKTATNYINDFESEAIKMAHKYGCYGVICGHIHQPADRHTEYGHYINSGDWVEGGTGVLVTDTNEIIKFEI
jgi:UDP-2,3-diacylglucosamine pyrophosphatase LpxH